MLPVTVGIAAAEPGWLPPLAVLDDRLVVGVVACAVALTGSVLHVKSLIRERGRPRFAAGSRAFAVAGAALVALAVLRTEGSIVAVLPFLALVARAWLVRGRGWRPAAIGMVELAGLVLVVLGVAWPGG